ncbi:MAG: hypothetical protein JXB26_10920 [Candidatus Aminicenantes bacterium]|nr:hypothetical protein [Candidatus Aminicenantes bacterium]
MKHNICSDSNSFLVVLSVVCFFYFAVLPGFLSAQETDPQQERFEWMPKKNVLVSFTDFYCSFFISETNKFPVRVEGAYNEEEQMLLRDGDVLYVNRGKDYGFVEGQILVAVEIKERIGSPGKRGRSGFLAVKNGLVRIFDIGEKISKAKVERACSPVHVGDFLLSYQEFDEIRGDDLGYNISEDKIGDVRGQVFYLQNDMVQLGPGNRGIIDLGREDGLSIGDQIIAFHEKKRLEPFANLVVIDVQPKTATIKVLSEKDAVRKGDLVAVRKSETQSR